MIRDLGKRLATGFIVGCVLTAAPLLVSATTVFDDHFDGNSGGMPESWHYYWGPGTAVESGTVVTLRDDIMIVSDAVLDPSDGTVVLTMDLASTNADDAVWIALITPPNTAGLGCGIHPSDGKIEMGANDLDGGEQPYIVGYLSGYSGGPIKLTITMEPTNFSVSTDSPPFSSGAIDYNIAFPTFTRGPLGTAVNLFLADDVVTQGGGSSSIDRVMVDVQQSIPVESTTFGRVKVQYR
jgi:hypothetical protein